MNRGASPIQYGSVMGIFQLFKLCGCILCGKYFHHTGPKLLLILGSFSSSVTTILAGFLSQVSGISNFIGLASAIKAVEGLGDAALRTMSYTIITNEFPELVGSVVGILTFSIGLGVLVGPLTGGILHEIGGFTLPFVTMGCLLLVTTVVTTKVLPETQYSVEKLNSDQSIVSVLKVPSVSLFVYTIIAAGFALGLLMVCLEPHLHNFHLSTSALGAVFLLLGAMFEISSPIWGRLCDTLISPTLATIIGGLLVSTAFLVFGPAPYIPLESTIAGCCIAIVIFGIGFSGEFVGSFCGILAEAVEAGLPTDLVIRAHVSSLYWSSFSIGMFLGFGSGGMLLTVIGFKWVSVVVIGLHFLVVMGGSLHICSSRCSSSQSHSLIEDGGREVDTSLELSKSYGSLNPFATGYSECRPQGVVPP